MNNNFAFILERLSSRAKNSLITAQAFSEESKSPHIGTEHLLYGIVAEKSSFASEILSKNQFTPDNVRFLALQKQTSQVTEWKPLLSENLKKAVEKSAIVASQFGYQFIGTEHFLYGLVTENSAVAVKILEELKVNVKDLENQLVSMFEQIARFPDMEGEEEDPLALFTNRKKQTELEYHTKDLTQKARDGRLTPLIGREAEITRLITILGRKSKNNPVLIGGAGVGKTAIVEGLAQKIVEGKVPENLKNLRILSLDITSMVAGSMFRGEFENRLKTLLEEASADSNVVLFMDELHMLVGAGTGGGGGMDAANILKPALARGEVKIIGATTLSEYKQSIEKDSALERRFQSILVEEPTTEQTEKILLGIKTAYEDHHGLKIEDSAIKAAVELSSRYISDRHLPDKAVDLLDEAASAVKMSITPTKLQNSKNLGEETLKKLLEAKEKAVLSHDFTSALKLKEKEVELRKQLEEISKSLKQESLKQSAVIQAGDIAKTISFILKMPLEKLTTSGVGHLTNLEKTLEKSVVGQAEAVRLVARAVRRGRAGLGHPDRPIASFLFAGPSGVGKTELAKTLAEEVYGDTKALIRIDMSELSEKHTISRLIGAPAGYVGFGEGGLLTEAVRRKPYSVVLFDEVEKANPEVVNILLQILEDGRLTDSQGKAVNFKNTIIILTSNAGTGDPTNTGTEIGFAPEMQESDKNLQEKQYEKMVSFVENATKEFFRPELLNRLDHIVVFRPLSKENIRQVVKLQLEDLQKHLEQKNIRFEYTPDVVKFLAEKSFFPAQGARKVRQEIRERISDPLADLLIGLKLDFTGTVLAKLKDERVVFDRTTLKPKSEKQVTKQENKSKSSKNQA